MICQFKRLIYPRSKSAGDNSYMIALYRPCEDVLDSAGRTLSEIKVVGYCLPTTEKLRYDLQGHWGRSAKYGIQFEMDTFREVITPTKEGIIAYLASGQIKGIGPKTAEKIYDMFGADTLNMLDANPEKLLEVPGISKNKLEKICESYLASRGARDIVAFLAPHGITPNRAVKLYREYGSEAMDIVRTHPYRLCELAGIGFLTADKIAASMGVDPLSPERVDAALLYTLTDAETKGHLCMEKHDFLRQCLKLLRTEALTEDMAAARAARLLQNGQLISYGDKVYREATARAEEELAKQVVRMLQSKVYLKKGGLSMDLTALESRLNLSLNEEQREAVLTALTSSITVITGGPGTGKTMTQHQLAKWCDADIIIYVGCGERGNEMTQVLDEFRELKDPRSGRPLMERTILVANTSNMPVAAREASIYTGMTMAEYYRDMGYHVALMADSTSRWAEALREISGRLEEMPAEESFPAYLPSRLAGFYERAGFVDTLSGTEGSVTVIGAVSPQGGDFSEPVTQNTKRFVRCFWALDRSLAYARHFPSINWNNSYTEYFNDLIPWYSENFGEDFTELRVRIMALLNEESSLMEIVKLIGADILPDDQKLIIETAKVIREGFLQQNAFHATDTYMKPADQMSMLRVILRLYDGAKDLVAQNIPLRQLVDTGVFTALERMKFELGGGKPAAEFMELVDNAVASVRRANA